MTEPTPWPTATTFRMTGAPLWAVTLRRQDDPLFLQVKEAEASVLEAHLPKSAYENQGQRVVAGQRLMQAASDIFLGWIRGLAGRDFYWRQLRDMKGSAKIERLSSDQLVLYASICGWAIACRSRRIWAKANASMWRLPTLRRPTPIRPNETTRLSVRPSRRARSRLMQEPEEFSLSKGKAGRFAKLLEGPDIMKFI